MIKKIYDACSADLLFLKDLKQNIFLKENLFLIESLKVYKKSIQSNIKIEKVITTQEVHDENKDFFKSQEVLITSSEILNKLIKFKSHTKVFAIGKIPNNKINYNDDIILFNNITSPENVGAITRSALAFNINQIVYDKGSLNPWNRRSVRVSTGNIFKFNTKRILDTESFINDLKAKEYDILSMANSKGSVSIKNYNGKNKKLIILGSEGHGIEKSIMEASDKILKIPVNEFVEHLNVGHAAAITFYQLKS